MTSLLSSLHIACDTEIGFITHLPISDIWDALLGDITGSVDADEGARQDANIANIKERDMDLRIDFILMFLSQTPNGLRYPRWGGWRNAVRLEKG